MLGMREVRGFDGSRKEGMCRACIFGGSVIVFEQRESIGRVYYVGK